MIKFQSSDDSIESAKRFDEKDSLNSFKSEFIFPTDPGGDTYLYFAGHSLGLMPKSVPQFLEEECDKWGRLGVKGHMNGENPWLPYHELLTDDIAHIVGGKKEEVVSLSTLTVNLHLALVSFYRPTKNRFKILIENNTFPSDHYAVASQARFHGFNPKEAIIQLKSNSGELAVDDESVLEQIEKHADDLALVMFGNCNYLSGQCFDFDSIIKKCRQKDISVGFNLAHGAGNLDLKLSDWSPDFAVWCNYKYLNSGAGGLGGLYVNKSHLGKKDIPRFEGWWGHNKKTRFEMGPEFDPIPTAEAWQLSNPPIFAMAPVRASLQLFRQATMPKLIQKRDCLTAYLEWLLETKASKILKLKTPPLKEGRQTRGAMLCYEILGDVVKLKSALDKNLVMADFREPNIFRLSPPPIYTSFEDVHRLSEIIKEVNDE